MTLIGYHNAEQFWQCPRQARDKFMVYKTAGESVPEATKWRGTHERLFSKALSHVGDGDGTASSARAIEWYLRHTDTPDANTIVALTRVSDALSEAINKFEAPLISAGFVRSTEPHFTGGLPIGSPAYLPPLNGIEDYFVGVSPDIAWTRDKEIVLAEIKSSSKKNSRSFYHEVSDQLLFYSQSLRSAGWTESGALMLLVPENPFVSNFPGDKQSERQLPFSSLPLVDSWTVNTHNPDPDCPMLRHNREIWSAMFKLIRSTPEQMTEWKPRPYIDKTTGNLSGWCNTCDTRTTCPALRRQR